MQPREPHEPVDPMLFGDDERPMYATGRVERWMFRPHCDPLIGWKLDRFFVDGYERDRRADPA